MENLNKNITSNDFFKDILGKKDPIALFRSMMKSKNKDLF